MDCLRQFQVYINQTRSFTAAGTNYGYWPGSFQFPWNARTQAAFFNYAIQGFKNIDIYGVKMLGYVQSPVTSTNRGIVEDYSFHIGFAGQNPQVSGVITTNNYNGQTNVTTVHMSKFQNEIMFAQPIKSCTSLSIGQFLAQGVAGENAVSIDLTLDMQIYFFYKFEGE